MKVRFTNTFLLYICVTAEPQFSDMESPDWMQQSLHNIENLRPVTPTGHLVDVDPDLLIRSKPTSPAVGEVEQPQTPGRGIELELESEDSCDELLSLSPASSDLILVSATPVASSHKGRPRTPGREDKSDWMLYSSLRAPATPGKEVKESSTVTWPSAAPALLEGPYISAPKTPGSDCILPRTPIVHRRKTEMVTTSEILSCDCHRVSQMSVSTCSPSNSSSNSADGRGSRISSGVRTKPLQRLENMPGLLDEDSWRETEESLLRTKRLRRQKRRWTMYQQQRSLKRISVSVSSHGRRSSNAERRILHRVWKEGLDEEDARLLRFAYDRLQARDCDLGWITCTLWIPHPHILLHCFIIYLECRCGFYLSLF